jgi:hypothetical protein
LIINENFYAVVGVFLGPCVAGAPTTVSIKRWDKDTVSLYLAQVCCAFARVLLKDR